MSGLLDTNFNAAVSGRYVHSVAAGANGKVVIGGNFDRVNGTARNAIARLNSDGTLDLSFAPGTGPNSEVLAVALDAEEKVLIGGFFTSVNGVTRNRIARLKADGSPDTTFNPGTGADNGIRVIRVQGDGRVLIGGQFARVSGAPRSCIARLNPDGSLDTSFDPGQGISGGLYNMIQSVAVQADGSILVGGSFDRVNGAARSNLVLLNSNGKLDTNFTAKLDSPVRSIALQADGQVLIGGEFSGVNGALHSRIARLQTGAPAPMGFRLLSPEHRAGGFHCRISGPSSCRFVVEASTDLVQWLPIFTNASSSGGQELEDSLSADYASRFYRVRW